MARPEKPVVAEVECIAEFAQGLRALRRSAGLTLDDLSKRAHYSISVLSEAASGKKLPTLDVAQAYAKACGADEAEWTRRWHAADTQLPDAAAVSAEAEVVTITAHTAHANGHVLVRQMARTVTFDSIESNEPTPTGRVRSVAVIGAVAAMVVAIALSVLVFRMSNTAGAVPAGYSSGAMGGGPWVYTEVADNRSGVPVFTDSIGTASKAGPIPLGTSVQVLCWAPNHSAMKSISNFYLLAGPTKWVGLYAPANTFANGDPPGSHGKGAAIDPQVPKCGGGSSGRW